MKKITYTCNLCGDEHSKQSAIDGNILSYYFNCGVVPQQYELRKYDAECDKHICKPCVNIILEQNGKPKN